MTTFLIVDDSPIERKLAAGILASQFDGTVVAANNGQEAITELNRRAGAIDVIVSDLRMPVMDGMELLTTIRGTFPNVPVIIMTSRGSEEIAVQALQNGAAGYVTKKQIRQQLGDFVRKVLNANRRNRDQERIFDCIERNEISLLLENDRNRLPGVISYLQDAAAKFGLCDDGDYARLGVALEEALLNALTHGNLEVSSDLRQRDDGAFDRLIAERQTQEPYASRRIHVNCLFTKNSVTFCIRDEGPGFDPSQLPDPTDPENLLKPSGRGVLLMRSFMDRLEYNETGNEVTLTRFARSEDEAPATKRNFGALPLPV